jgi:hypothetical protein
VDEDDAAAVVVVDVVVAAAVFDDVVCNFQSIGSCPFAINALFAALKH